MSAVDITVAGRDFRIGCDAGQEEHLQSLATYVDERLHDIKKGFGVVNDSMAQVMLMIMLSDELHEVRSEANGLRNQLKSVAGSFESGKATDMERLLANTLHRVTERIEKMADKVNS